MRLSLSENLKGQLHALVNFLIGTFLILIALFMGNEVGKFVEVFLGVFSILMLAEKTWKFIRRGFIHFSIEDAYIFLSAIVILTLIVWQPDYFFKLQIKAAFGIVGVFLIVLAINDFLRRAKGGRN
jgi:hypothetical protein